MALAALLALFLQSLAVQSHIHPVARHILTPATSADHLPLPGPLKSPDFDQSSCRLCQEIAHAGAYLTPTAILLPVALAYAAAPLRQESVALVRAAPAFSWQSRGPPAH